MFDLQGIADYLEGSYRIIFSYSYPDTPCRCSVSFNPNLWFVSVFCYGLMLRHVVDDLKIGLPNFDPIHQIGSKKTRLELNQLDNFQPQTCLIVKRRFLRFQPTSNFQGYELTIQCRLTISF